MLFDNYYIKGCISGMTGIILSHPVDSIKTFIQTNNNSKNFIFNIKNLYKGISSPLIGVGFEKAIVFGTYNLCKNNNINIPISGALSGLSASIIVSPYERIKIMKQTNQVIKIKQYFNPFFMFKGLSATFTREVPGFAIYFSTYEYLKYTFYTKNNNNISIISSFIFGGISGTMAWIFIYPQDRIKTIIQSNNNNSNYSTIINNIYKTGGFRQFYNGFTFAVARAILLHSGTFCTIEFLSSFKKYDNFE
jgi:solute carrier family 25 carnitine/acylcarnitine transporter 20/29